jgi:hypothetical protein
MTAFEMPEGRAELVRPAFERVSSLDFIVPSAQ